MVSKPWRSRDITHSMTQASTPQTSPHEPDRATSPCVHVSGAEFQDAPAHLRAAAHLYGIECVPIAKARILELGCSGAGGLLPYVTAHPEASAVGIDLSPEHIAAGRAACRAMGIKNLELRAMGLEELFGSELGLFDYIVVHGVFSLVDPGARGAILHYCLDHLNPLGLVSVRYSTYPGAKIREILRDGIQLHTSTATTAGDRLNGARAMLTFLARGLSDQNPYAKAIRRTVQTAEGSSDFSLSFDYLQGLDSPCYLLDFATQIQKLGLAYVGDALPHSELPETYGKGTAEMHAALGDGIDKVIAQQYLDFLTGRACRTSLLVAADRAATILRAPDLDRLADLSLAGSFKRIVTDDGAIGQGHITGQGGVVGLDDDVSLQILDSLGRVWPSPLTFEQLSKSVRDPVQNLLPDIDSDTDRRVKAALKVLYPAAGKVLRLSMDPSPYQGTKSRNLRIIEAALYALRQIDPPSNKSCQIAPSNFWHDTAVLDIKSYERNWLQLFNGRIPFESAVRKAQAIWDALSPDALSSEIRAKFPQIFCTWIDRLRAQGLLTGAINAWEPFFQYAIRTYANQPDHAFSYAASLLMHVCPYQFGGLQTTHQPQAESSGPLPGELPRQELDRQGKALDNLIQAGKYREATVLAEEAAHKWPAEYQIWSNLTRLSLQRGTATGTQYPALRALALRPRLTQAYADLALAMWRSGKSFSLEWIVRQLLRINDEIAQCWDLLGQVLETGSNHGHEAELCSRRAVELAPSNIVYLSNLAGICSVNMKNDDAELFYRRAAAIDPGSSWVLSNLLFTLAHKESVDSKELFEEHRRYGRLVQRREGSTPYHEYLNDKNPNRPLKVGFVSADLHAHVVSYFVEEIWKELDSSKIQVYVYSNTRHEDQITARLKNYAHNWESIVGIDDSIVAENIHSAQIDVLVDLSGHTGNNRLPLFALKPAPVQISFIGYPGTTGLEEMDYRITYSTENLDIADQFTEKLMCLPYVFRFKDTSAPEVNDLPAQRNGYLTFASFNRPQKIGATIFDAWARILHAAPGSKMLIANMDGQAMMDDFTGRFEKLGISEERLLLRPRAEKASYMLMHHDVDMMLDTFPYGGGTTINHACWMGVPSLTIKGKTAVGRYGAMINSQLGLREFIAESLDEYVKSATVWAQKFNELAEIRRNLRCRMRDSGISGNGGAAHYLEKGVYAAWKRWCDGLSADHLIIQPD